MNPMSFAYSRKHCLQTLRPYFLIKPHWLLHTRLQGIAKPSGPARRGSQLSAVPQTHHSRPPLENLQGWEFQTSWCPIVSAPGAGYPWSRDPAGTTALNLCFAAALLG